MGLMSSLCVIIISSISWSFLILCTHGIQPSQKQVLLQIRKQLEYPKELDIWLNNNTTDLCYFSSPQVNITCQDNFVSELRILGDYNKAPGSKVSGFNGFSVPSQTLSGNFSMDSLVATLSRLTSLRVLALVSVGIWGPVPDKIQRLYSLEHLDLSWNFLFGSIPHTVSRMVNLQTVTLDGNYLNGTFPDSLDSLSVLNSLSIRGNGISGNLPSLPKGLVLLFLNNNSLSGEIPKGYSQLNQLQQLDLSFNSLEGPPPPALFSLPNISYLNLASNMLSGSVPNHLSCGNALGLVDISNNKLRGSLPTCLSTALGKRVVKYSGNCLSIDTQHQHNETYCIQAVAQAEKKEKQTSGKRSLAIVLAIIGSIFIVMVLLVTGFVVLCRKLCPRGTSEQKLLHKPVQDPSVTGYPSELLTTARFVSETAKLGMQGLPVHRLFAFDELKEATNNFSRSASIGEGSTGKLYKGKLSNGTQVAIRLLTVSKKYTIRNLKLRLDLLARLRHPHLVCLLGHCIGGEGNNNANANVIYLIYEYVPNGNYRSCLSEDSPERVLKWSDRLTILTGIAKAVHFLHTGIIPGFFNNRLKTNNILFNEHGIAKLSDYGLSIIADDNENDDAKGEDNRSWQMKRLEDDVYSFGFILLESLAGPFSVTSRKEEFVRNEMDSFTSEEGRRQVVDPTVLASCSQESLTVIITITKKCFASDPSARPSFEDILWHLQYAAQVQATTVLLS